ncbi:alpha-glucosidase [Fructilactobacillus myrtifloralis]|uniref:Alpha-glucosidase n=1 Tax=Fructilactobacillus myrtifloralis TaxID=2940301 RepID=A0ABY5BMA1_9LACO|nr:alpha-glucosidase [Fructilactobacillus myrtifloralis]USS84695.1 alpha-glucosidase [Fructilactobacillus myrtifloralis]
MQTQHPAWWQDEVIYEIYPRSFNDSNGDGVGDLPGITAKLDYLQHLGVTLLWIAPFYRSPMVDMGYDIADYQAVDPLFGTLADLHELIRAARKRGLKVMLDLVANHTSDQHPWFQAALADPTSPYRKYYIFKTTTTGQPPNNWRGIFGGSTWTPVPNEPGTYYFHTFTAEQPDLNWENPALRSEMYRIINWWLAQGIAGFRLDAITHLKKDQDWASLPADGPDGLVSVTNKGLNRPGLGTFLREMRDATFARVDAVTIGEAAGVGDDQLGEFVGPNGYFSLIFDFSYLNLDVADANQWEEPRPWSVKQLATTIFASQTAMQQAGGKFANVLENHDQNRALSKFVPNPAERTPMAAKALATLYFFLAGVPVIYQGQELGMQNFQRTKIADFNDVSSLNNYYRLLAAGNSPATALAIVNWRSRDNARVPMQWDETATGGFTTGTPWLQMGIVRRGISVQTEAADPTSVLNYYRRLIRVWRSPTQRKVLRTGALLPVATGSDSVIAYRRRQADQCLLVLVNLSQQVVTSQSSYRGRVVLDNYTVAPPTTTQTITKLQPYQALVLWEL